MRPSLTVIRCELEEERELSSAELQELLQVRDSRSLHEFA